MSNRFPGRSFLGLKQCAFFFWQLCDPGVLAQLKCSDVADDGPAIRRWNLFCVVRHHPKAASDDVKKVTVRRAAQTIDMKGRRRPVSPSDDHAVTGAGPVMARRAEDVVAFLAAQQDVFCNWEWETIH